MRCEIINQIRARCKEAKHKIILYRSTSVSHCLQPLCSHSPMWRKKVGLKSLHVTLQCLKCYEELSMRSSFLSKVAGLHGREAFTTFLWYCQVYWKNLWTLNLSALERFCGKQGMVWLILLLLLLMILELTQPAFTFPKLTIETLEKGVIYV